MLARRGTVWITRTPEGAKRTARSVEALGFEALVAPVLKVRPIRALIDPHSFDAIIVTSRNGLNVFCELCPRRSITVWCVGDSTADAARAKKFQHVVSAEGDVNALQARLILEADKSTRLLYIAPKDPAAPLTQTLRANGFKINETAVYETLPVIPALTGTELARITHVMIHSPKAAQALRPILNSLKDRLALETIHFLCISEATARAMDEQNADNGVKNISHTRLIKCISKFPDEASLLMLLQDA